MLVAVLATLLGAVIGGYIPPGPRYPCPPHKNLLYPCICEKGTDTGLTVKCQYSNLASLAVALSNIVGLGAPVDRLTISHSKFSRLYGDMLYALEIKTLVIEDTPVREVEPFTFLGVNRTLQELHLIRTQLEKFPTEAFQILGKLAILNIDGHKIQTLPVGSIAGFLPGSLEKFSFVNGNLSDLPPETLINCKRLKRLDLHGNKFKTLRKNQFKGLRDVEILDLSYNLITKIDASHLGDLNKLTSCNLSHNAISDVTRGAFARNTVLRSLNLNYNKLRKIDANSFRGMRFIRRLYMSDNEISDVGRGTFASVSRIGTIDLARNKIKNIDFQMFSQLQYVELIDVSDNQVTEIQKQSFKDLYLVHINLSHNAISKIEKDSFINCANITVLDLSYNKLSEIPANAFDDITYATELHLAYNELKDLSKVPLANMTGLKVLNVTFNQLERIPRNTFPKLYELHTIDVSYNSLSEIYNGVFQTLFGLRFLNLSHNQLNEIKSSTFGPLPTLLEMDLSYNNLAEISRGSLTRLTSLQRLNVAYNNLSRIFQLPISLSHLNLSFNSIEKIPANTWPSMNALQSLDLSNNYLQDSLESGSFANLLILQKLDLSYNGIYEPPWQSLSDISSLQYLNLENNYLRTLGKGAFGRLPIVFDLNLAHNQLNNISVRAFEGLLQLLNLNMSHNDLTHIPNGAFQGLVSLRTLDLSHNLLEKLDNKTHGLIDDCLSLEKIILSHNKISDISRKTFPSDPYVPRKLKYIDLSHNLMSAITFGLTFGTKKVQTLNLSHNMIDEIRRYVIGNLSSLELLDLSNNEIKELNEPDTFNVPPIMNTLYLQNNELTTLPIKKLTKLKTLDIRQNYLEHYYIDITKMVLNGSNVLYDGNELTCDCHLRPLRRWLLEDPSRITSWSNIKCSYPNILNGTRLIEANENDMYCIGHDENENEEYDTTPDLKFREVKKGNGKWTFTWYVTAKQDIADFKVIIRDPSNGGMKEGRLVQKALPYNARSAVLNKVPKSRRLEICVVALDSEGFERDLHNLQCQSLPISGKATACIPHLYLLCATVTLLLSIYR
ncbi:hypothetical protein AAG570_010731 [Ranatra chinensis]|uniref:LRRCT domain-containing protein n=1 Tax=Ranatra chinensis TaxID=642074 RepID=A0ABD0ZBR4_9HEMI